MQKDGYGPQVSVIMPAYNAQKYIGQAIESVLIQKIPLELLIIIDNSKDDTINIVNNYRQDQRVIVLENERNLGVAESRNEGIRMAKGKYIAFLDADDWWAQGKLSIQCKVMEEEDAVLCCTGRELMKPDGTAIGKCIGVPEKITYKMLLRTNSIPCSSVLLRAEVAKEFGMCHDEMHEDYILWLRVLKKYKTALGINEPLLKSRMSEGGKSRNKLKSAKMQWNVYRFIGIGKWKTFYYFLCYGFYGLRKYFG